jgi:3-phenylpropionate/cinnamic acid dioxygenase small subunit
VPISDDFLERALYGSLTPQAPQLHVATNVVVTDVDGERATATADLVFLLRGEAGWSVALVAGYDDVRRHEAGRWRFASRVMTVRD